MSNALLDRKVWGLGNRALMVTVLQLMHSLVSPHNVKVRLCSRETPGNTEGRKEVGVWLMILCALLVIVRFVDVLSLLISLVEGGLFFSHTKCSRHLLCLRKPSSVLIAICMRGCFHSFS